MVRQLVEHWLTDPLVFGINPSNSHFVYLGKILHSDCLWAEEFHQFITSDICGLVPHRLFSMGFLQTLWYPPTVIRQAVKRLNDWIWLESSTLDSVLR